VYVVDIISFLEQLTYITCLHVLFLFCTAEVAEITSIFPRIPLILTVTYTSLEVLVHYNYIGTIATCTAFGHPPLSVRWVINGGGLTSNSITTSTSSFVTAHLTSNNGFRSFDAGNYLCEVRQSGSHMHLTNVQSLKLNIIDGDKRDTSRFECSVKAIGVIFYFQFRVHFGDCRNWKKKTYEWIRDFSDVLASAVSGTCTKNCPISADTIEIRQVLCSNEFVRFRGEIFDLDSAIITRDIFCAFEEWQKSGGVIMIDNRFYSVDKSHQFRYNYLTEAEATQNRSMLIAIVGVPTFIAMLVLVILIVKQLTGLRRKNEISKVVSQSQQ